jgi:hypothetical protein
LLLEKFLGPPEKCLADPEEKWGADENDRPPPLERPSAGCSKTMLAAITTPNVPMIFMP